MTWWEIVLAVWLALGVFVIVWALHAGRQRVRVREIRNDLALRRLDREQDWDWPKGGTDG